LPLLITILVVPLVGESNTIVETVILLFSDVEDIVSSVDTVTSVVAFVLRGNAVVV
jgi:hypothetical protein